MSRFLPTNTLHHHQILFSLSNKQKKKCATKPSTSKMGKILWNICGVLFRYIHTYIIIFTYSWILQQPKAHEYSGCSVNNTLTLLQVHCMLGLQIEKAVTIINEHYAPTRITTIMIMRYKNVAIIFCTQNIYYCIMKTNPLCLSKVA